MTSVLDAGQFLLEPIAESRVVNLVGQHDVDAAHAAKPAEQIEVGRPEPARIGRMIRDRDDDVIEREVGLRREKRRAKHVLVEDVAARDRPRVAEEGESQKRGLSNQPLAAAIRAALDAKLVEERAREPPDRSLPAAQLVVEIEHRRHEPGPELKRRAAETRPRGGGPGGALQHDLPFEPAGEWRPPRQGAVQAREPAGACHEIRKQQTRPKRGGRPRPRRARFERLAQELGRRVRRHDHHAAARGKRWTLERELGDGVTEGGKIARPNQPAALGRHDPPNFGG